MAIRKFPIFTIRNNYENVTMIKTMDYQGDFQYENGVLQFIAQPEGYIYKDATGYRYVYQYRDHLGNNRLSFMRNAGTVAIVKESNYYPFGLTHQGYNNLTTSLGSAGAKKYLYNGKELQEDFGLDWYDYGARFYDAGLGRWFVVDPMAEKATSWTPYRYAFDNPVNITDPNGMFEDWVEKTLSNGTKKVEWDKNVTSSDDPDLKSGDKYLGKTGYGVEGTGDNEKLTYYGSDGQKQDASIGLNEVEIDGGKMSDHARTMSNPIVQHMHEQQKNLFPESPDMIGISVSGNFIFVMGAGQDFSLIHVKNEGWSLMSTTRGGAGIDISVGIGIVSGNSTLKKPTVRSLEGVGFNANGGTLLINGGAWVDYNTVSKKAGRIWKGQTYGISIGSKTLVGGSSGISVNKIIYRF